MHTARSAELLSLRASRFAPPGAVNLAKGRVMFSVGDPTHRIAQLTRAADWFDKYTR